MMVGFHGIGLPVPKGNPSEIRYLLRDEFITDRAAGAVNGTPAEPIGGNRSVIDTENKIVIGGGKLSFTGGRTSPVLGDPGLWYAVQDRAAGKNFVASINIANASTTYRAGWSSTASGAASDAIRIIAGPSLTVSASGITGPVVMALSTATYYLCAIIQRAIGTISFIKVNETYLLVWIAAAGNGSLYPCFTNFDSTFTADYIRIPTDLWLPTPLCSDGFGSAFGTSDGLGHAEGIAGGIGSGGGGQAWTQQSGMWGISSGKAIASSLLSGEAVATVPLSTANPFVGIDLARTLGDVGGVARWTDANNHLRWYHDGTNHVLQQVVSGTPTTLITAAATYSANARSWLWLNGTTARLYYNNTLTGSTSSINAGLTAMNVGIRTTGTANAMDNFAAYAVGVEGQYNLLNQY